MLSTCTRRFSFCAGHRLLGHGGRCAFPHGHNYVAWVTVEGAMNDLGMVVDFGDLKHCVGNWIDQYWDHAFLVNPNDLEMQEALQCVETTKVYIMPSEYPNPTAEAMAAVLRDVAINALEDHNLKARVTQVHVQETENGHAGVAGCLDLGAGEGPF